MATVPILFTICMMEKWSAAVPPSGLAPASCHRKTKKPKALVPRKLVKIVTVTLQTFFEIEIQQGSAGMRPRGPHSRADHPQLLSHKVVGDDAGYFDWLSGELRRREP